MVAQEKRKKSSRELRLGGSAGMSVHGPREMSVAPEVILQRDTRCLSYSLVASNTRTENMPIELLPGKTNYNAPSVFRNRCFADATD